jgi:hypothetical protein
MLTSRTNSALLGVPGVKRVLAMPFAFIVAGLGAVAGWWAVSGDRRVGVAAASLLLFGLYELGRAIGVLYRRRRRADDWLRSATGDVVPEAYAWRAAQLTSTRERRLLANSLRLVAQRALDRSTVVRPLRLSAARERRVALEALAKRLEREAEPVTPGGMLRVVDLVTAGGGPLWGTNEKALGEAIDATLSLLGPSSGGCAGVRAA